MRQVIEWHSAAPLWERILAAPGTSRLTLLRRPVLLRFDSDNFMEQLAGQLERDPAGLADYLVQPESWRQPAVGWQSGTTPTAQEEPVTLFQPIHGRFYLVAVSLVCRLPGLPERAVAAAAQERVSFVVRRLTGGSEQAWIGDRQQGKWQPVDDNNSPLEGEERLGLFPLNFRQDGRRRRLLAGLIPVAGREVYETATRDVQLPISSENLPNDPLAAFEQRVLEPLGSFEDFPTSAAGDEAQLDRQAREVLAFALLDFSELLQSYLKPLWQALEEGSESGLSDNDKALYRLLDSAFGTSLDTPWRTLLVNVEVHRQKLLQQDFASLNFHQLQPPLPIGDLELGTIQGAASSLLGDGLAARLEASLAERSPDGDNTQSPPQEEQPRQEGVYIIRCLYERPRCRPFIDPVVSAPSRPFRLASFFEPEATVRPLSISMPVDTSLKGLRSFPKGVSVLLSKQLRQQMERAQQAGF
ncbi:MAG: hypothetical protein R3310_05905, partial [Candidatus Competibacteraceae bacterium]|nr:hypothetical protein [Candidatus Competibacteraceae bacterium]